MTDARNNSLLCVNATLTYFDTIEAGLRFFPKTGNSGATHLIAFAYFAISITEIPHFDTVNHKVHNRVRQS